MRVGKAVLTVIMVSTLMWGAGVLAQAQDSDLESLLSDIGEAPIAEPSVTAQPATDGTAVESLPAETAPVVDAEAA